MGFGALTTISDSIFTFNGTGGGLTPDDEESLAGTGGNGTLTGTSATTGKGGRETLIGATLKGTTTDGVSSVDWAEPSARTN